MMPQIPKTLVNTPLSPVESARLKAIVLPPLLKTVLKELQAVGARGLLVGGAVRDALLGWPVGDFDVEVFGLSAAALESLLKSHGPTSLTGKQFGVFRLNGLPVDFALPRREYKKGPGHRGFQTEACPDLSFKEAAQRRDLTINSMGYDPLSATFEDPFGGRADLALGRLQYIDPVRFQEDPLRPLRVMRFAAYLHMQPSKELQELCGSMPLDELPRERIAGEFHVLFTRGGRPSLGLDFLKNAGLLKFCPEWLDLTPEAWAHMCRAFDTFALRQDVAPALKEPGMLAIAGIALAPEAQKTLWRRICLKDDDIRAALVLAETYHRFGVVGPYTHPAVRRWARVLARHALSWAEILPFLESISPAATVGALWDAVQESGVLNAPLPAAVTAADLMARGVVPGPALGGHLKAAEEIQDESGLMHPEDVLARLF